MRRIRPVFVCLFVAALLLGTSSSARADAILTLSPEVQAGDMLSLNIDISGVTDLSSFQFDLAYDPTLFSALSVEEGTFLSENGSLETFFIEGFIDNTSGLITFVADALLGPFSVEGSGTLATIQFLAPNFAGLDSFSLSNVFLLDSNSFEIPFTVNTVPEPSSLALVGLGLATLYSRRRRGRGDARKNIRSTV